MRERPGSQEHQIGVDRPPSHSTAVVALPAATGLSVSGHVVRAQILDPLARAKEGHQRTGLELLPFLRGARIFPIAGRLLLVSVPELP